MDRVLVSRQPIYRADMREFGYELLFREGNQSVATFTDGDRATANIIVNTFMDIGLNEVVGKNLAFINFERNLILGSYCESLPRERVVLEVLESVTPDTALIEKLWKLRSKGYRIALDDFACSDSASALLEVANFVKFDRIADDCQTLEKWMAFARKYPVQLIAEKVETVEQFERCKKLGFDYFQGYFFCRPQMVQGRKVPVSRLAAMRLMVKLNATEVNIDELQKVISEDVTLTYKLLRYINSAMYSLTRNVTSIRHAIMLVGQQTIRTWASLILLSSVEDNSRDLVITGAVRGRMCQDLATTLGLPNPDQMFLVGLLSVLDGLLDQPMEEILQQLPLDPGIADALRCQKGALGAVLRSVLEYEKQNWDGAESAAKLPQETMTKAYQKSLAWSLTTLKGVSN
jgi:EAL and modified HD-GYP domain-containing signal transduction protein